MKFLLPKHADTLFNGMCHKIGPFPSNLSSKPVIKEEIDVS